MSDILDAVPIDKYFELFRPGAGGEGGFIRLGLDFSTDAPPPMPGAKQLVPSLHCLSPWLDRWAWELPHSLRRWGPMGRDERTKLAYSGRPLAGALGRH